MKPPQTMVLRFCPACGRDDRLKHLREGGRFPHKDNEGRTCPGETIRLTYKLEKPA